MKHLTPLLLSGLALFCTAALAERADKEKPMAIDADTLRHDDLKQISIFDGRVVVTKGTILMRGARLEVRQDAQGNQFGILTAEPGKRAFFRQKRDGVDEYIEGEGQQIEYDSKADTVRVLRQAELRRYLGATLGDEITGNVIVYNGTTEMFTVDGVPGAPGSSGRVRAILAPRPPASAATGPAGAAPPRPAASQPAPVLRSSTTLDGEKK